MALFSATEAVFENTASMAHTFRVSALPELTRLVLVRPFDMPAMSKLVKV
jgi:hypothetical protein